jgi:hypothetical protein
MTLILDKIKDFCAVRNIGPAFMNGFSPTPRVKFILELLEENKIGYELERFFVDDVPMYNIIMAGENGKMIIAHHDIVNPNSDNANDNTASVLNAIYLKKISPSTNVVLTDGEECGFWGAKRLGEQINSGKFGQIDWVLNLELTGKGGKNIFVGKHSGSITKIISEKFSAPIVRTPPSDCSALEALGINTTVINPLPLLKEGEVSEILGANGYLDNSSWYDCHSESDSLSKISIPEMQEFVEEILLPLVSADISSDV